MTEDPLRYDLWIEDAFRSVVRRALRHTETHGLPGDHHFYITLRTGHPGVRIPAYLKAMHPDEMTIVLQFKFEDLSVGDDGFSVTLSFKGKRENLYVPWTAVTSFADPSVNFGLQFKAVPGGAVEASAAGETQTHPFRPDKPDAATKTPPATPPAAEAASKPASQPAAKPPAEGGQVIALDSFRKK